MKEEQGSYLSRRALILIVGSIAFSILSGLLTGFHAGQVLTFFISAIALAWLAALVGESTDQLGSYLGAGATGVVQSALGNLPELFVSIFALRAGLLAVVQSALIGSILSNTLLVLGLAFFLGGLKFGSQYFHAQTARMIATLTLLAVFALVIPTMAKELHIPAANHEDTLGIASAIILLFVFIASIPFSLQGGMTNSHSQTADITVAVSEKEEAALKEETALEERWPFWLTIVLLVAAGIGAAFVSDWFVAALQPAITYLHISQAFTGLVIVAIAGNAVEHLVGIQFAVHNKMDYAINVILNSSLQIALGLTPILVLLSFIIGGVHLTLVFSPFLVLTLTLAAILAPIILYDGRSTWIEGLILIGLYGIIAVSFWWG